MGEGSEIRVGGGGQNAHTRARRGKPGACPRQQGSQELGLCSLLLPGAEEKLPAGWVMGGWTVGDMGGWMGGWMDRQQMGGGK